MSSRAKKNTERFVAEGRGAGNIYVSASTAEQMKKKLGKLPSNVRVRRERPSREDRFAIKEVRTEAGMTQEQLATRIGVRQSAISRIEKQSDMSVSTLEDYVEALGGHIELVIDGKRHALRKHD